MHLKYLWGMTFIAVLLGPPIDARAKIRIVSTIPDFGAIAQEIGGNLVEVTALVRPTQDPHFVDAKPSFVIKLNRAQLLLLVGMELEGGWLPPLLVGSRNRNIQ
jgi:ABC-type Zn uptake system ZnuABC Zn-binding protein ZnuA